MRLALYTFTALLLIMGAAACSSDSDSLTLDEYFAEFAAIEADTDAQIEAAFEALFTPDVDEDTLFEDDANLPAVKELAAAFPRIAQDSHDRVEALDPPSELASAHHTLVETLEVLVHAFTEADAALSEAQTMAEFGQIEAGLGSTNIEPSQANYEAACLAVVAIGETNNIDVSTITCQGE